MEHTHRDHLKPNIDKYAGIVLPSEVFTRVLGIVYVLV